MDQYTCDLVDNRNAPLVVVLDPYEAFENSILCSNRLNVLTQFWIDGMTGWPSQCLRAAAAILDNARWLAARGRLRQLWWPGAFEDVLKFLGEVIGKVRRHDCQLSDEELYLLMVESAAVVAVGEHEHFSQLQF